MGVLIINVIIGILLAVEEEAQWCSVVSDEKRHLVRSCRLSSSMGFRYYKGA